MVERHAKPIEYQDTYFWGSGSQPGLQSDPGLDLSVTLRLKEFEAYETVRTGYASTEDFFNAAAVGTGRTHLDRPNSKPTQLQSKLSKWADVRVSNRRAARVPKKPTQLTCNQRQQCSTFSSSSIIFQVQYRRWLSTLMSQAGEPLTREHGHDRFAESLAPRWY